VSSRLTGRSARTSAGRALAYHDEKCRKEYITRVIRYHDNSSQSAVSRSTTHMTCSSFSYR
jgi:hypothetical protein